MSPLILNALLMVADMQVKMPAEPVPTVQERAQDQRQEGVKADCYPWFKENNYKCPSPKDQ